MCTKNNVRTTFGKLRFSHHKLLVYHSLTQRFQKFKNSEQFEDKIAGN